MIERIDGPRILTAGKVFIKAEPRIVEHHWFRTSNRAREDLIAGVDQCVLLEVDDRCALVQHQPMRISARVFYVWVLLLNRRINEARLVLAQFPAEVRGSVPARLARFLVSAAENEGQEARAALGPEFERIAGASDVFPRLLAQGFAWAGMRPPALKWLRTAVNRGFINYPFLARHDHSFKALRSDPKFRELLDNVRARWERFAA